MTRLYVAGQGRGSMGDENLRQRSDQRQRSNTEQQMQPPTAQVSLCAPQVHAVIREANLMRRVEGHKHIVKVRRLLAASHHPPHVAGASDSIAVRNKSQVAAGA